MACAVSAALPFTSRGCWCRGRGSGSGSGCQQGGADAVAGHVGELARLLQVGAGQRGLGPAEAVACEAALQPLHSAEAVPWLDQRPEGAP